MSQYIATKFKASSPEAEVIGQAMLPFTQILTAEEIEPIMNAQGIEQVEPDTWYKQQTFCNIYQDIVENEGNFSMNLVAIGKTTMGAVTFPDEVDTLYAALSALDGMYKAIHQGIPAEEGWAVAQPDDRTYLVTFNSPYADSAAYGYVWTITQRFRPDKRGFIIEQVEKDGITQFTVRLD